MTRSSVTAARTVQLRRAIAAVTLLFGALAITGEIGWWRTGGRVFGRGALVGLLVATCDRPLVKPDPAVGSGRRVQHDLGPPREAVV